MRDVIGGTVETVQHLFERPVCRTGRDLAGVHLRDSRNGQNYITFNRSDWVGFVAEAQGHSRAAETSAIRVSGGSDDVEVACRDSDESLTFSRCDWDIFLEASAPASSTSRTR